MQKLFPHADPEASHPFHTYLVEKSVEDCGKPLLNVEARHGLDFLCVFNCGVPLRGILIPQGFELGFLGCIWGVGKWQYLKGHHTWNICLWQVLPCQQPWALCNIPVTKGALLKGSNELGCLFALSYWFFFFLFTFAWLAFNKASQAPPWDPPLFHWWWLGNVC